MDRYLTLLRRGLGAAALWLFGPELTVAAAALSPAQRLAAAACILSAALAAALLALPLH